MFVLLAVVAALVFGNGLNNGFVFDDYDLVVENTQIRDLSKLPEIFGLGDAPRRYRPVRNASYALDHALFGMEPYGFRAMNIAYHALCGFLVFLILRRLSDSTRIALIAALLFTVHPVQTDAVTYISGRRDVLSTLFYLFAFYAFLRRRDGGSAWWYGLVIVSFILGLFTKEMVVTLPVMMLVYDWFMGFRETTDGRTFVRTAGAALWQALGRYKWLYGPILVLVVLFLIEKVVINNPSRLEGLYGETWLLHYHTVFRILAAYLALLAAPVTLLADYSFETMPVSKIVGDPAAMAALLLVLAAWALTGFALAKRHLAGFAGLWFFVTLLPVSQIVPHHEMMAEHYLYLPSIGFCLLVALGFDWLATKHRLRSAGYVLCGMVVALYAGRSVVRNLDWRDGETLWTRTIADAPRNVRARLNLATVYSRRGDHQAALRELKVAVSIQPGHRKVHDQLGLTHYVLGDIPAAIRSHRRAVKLRPESATPQFNLGRALARAGDVDGALAAFKRATELRPGHARAHRELGTAYVKKRQLDKARHHYETALRLEPGFFEIYRYLGVVYAGMAQFDLAIGSFRTYLGRAPDDIIALQGISRLYLRDPATRKRALPHLRAILKLKPDHPQAASIRGLIKALGNGKKP